jgi:hypothetical protein
MRGEASEHRLVVCAPSGFETRCPLRRRRSPLDAQAEGLRPEMPVSDRREQRHT